MVLKMKIKQFKNVAKVVKDKLHAAIEPGHASVTQNPRSRTPWRFLWRARWKPAGLASSLKLAIGLTVLGMASVSLAQALPPATDPGRLRERFDIHPQPARPAEPAEVRRERADALPDSLKAVRLTLKSVRIEGATALPAADLQAKADSYTGREITGSEVLELASALTAMYRNAGYILSLVIIPPQSLADGTLRLQVIEGYIDRVYLQTGEGVGASLRAKLTEIGEKIKASRPIQAAVLERYLLIANDFPGIELRSVLTPSQGGRGAADLTLVAKVTQIEGFATVDNYGSKYLGPNQFGMGVTGNQLLGVNDQWRFTSVGTGGTEMLYGQFAYSQLVSPEGLKVSAAVSRGSTQPGDILKPFDIRGNADTVALSVSYPLLRTRNESVFARAAYEHSDINTDVLGTRTVEDKIRVLRLGLSWRVLDRLDGFNALDVDFTQGLGDTGASDVLKSRVGASGVFNKTSFDYERSQFIGPAFDVTVGVGGQWADSPLLSSEQFALGGRRFGRAYEPAELVGERALAFRIEPRHHGSPAVLGFSSYQLFGFFDIGQVWRAGDQTAGTPDRQSLASAGFGTRMFLRQSVVAVVEVAWPLTKPVASSPDNGMAARLLGSVVFRF
jgi:hemolysin activation/secretion protein